MLGLPHCVAVKDELPGLNILCYEGIGSVEVKLHTFFTLALKRGESSASHSIALSSGDDLMIE
jgi:hypothetical protein